jgi:hypothetical protein
MAKPAPRRQPWYVRLGVEVRNVAIVVVLGLVVLAALVGVVIGVTALALHH